MKTILPYVPTLPDYPVSRRLCEPFRLCSLGRSGKYDNTLCLSLQILNERCFLFLLGLRMVPVLVQNLGGQTKSIMVFSILANCKLKMHPQVLKKI